MLKIKNFENKFICNNYMSAINEILLNVIPSDLINEVLKYDAHTCCMKEIRERDRTDLIYNVPSFGMVYYERHFITNYTVWGLMKCYETLNTLKTLPCNKLTEMNISKTVDRINKLKGFY